MNSGQRLQPSTPGDAEADGHLALALVPLPCLCPVSLLSSDRDMVSLVGQQIYEFPTAAVMNHHKLSGLT